MGQTLVCLFSFAEKSTIFLRQHFLVMNIKDKNYRIVREPGEADHNFKTPSEIEGELGDLYSKVNKGKPSVKGRLDKLIKRYPGVPFLRNYLAQWYNVNQQPEAANRVNDEVLRLYPNYIFAISFKISTLLGKDDIEGAERLLAGRLDIESFYPNRRAFHISELRACTSLAVDYLLATGRFDEAEERINFLGDVDHDSLATEMLQQKLMKHRLTAGFERHKEYEDMEIHSVERVACTLPQKEVAMVASAPMFEFLYVPLGEIDEAELRNCINNHKEELVAELYRIITIAIEGYEYIEMDPDGNNKYPDVVLYALLILSYLEPETSFSKTLELLRQPYECCDFWLGDWDADVITGYFHHFTEEKLALIFSFITEHTANNSSKNILLELLPGFVLNNPDCRDKLIQCIRAVFDYFIAHVDDNTLFDSTVLSFAVGAVVDLKAAELLGNIERLYERNLVSLMMEGDFDEVQERLLSDESTLRGTFFDDVFAHLKDLQRVLDRINESKANDGSISSFDDEDYYDEDDEDEVEEVTKPVINIFAGASKNAPCPCGSGKKYKRCHGKD